MEKQTKAISEGSILTKTDLNIKENDQSETLQNVQQSHMEADFERPPNNNFFETCG